MAFVEYMLQSPPTVEHEALVKWGVGCAVVDLVVFAVAYALTRPRDGSPAARKVARTRLAWSLTFFSAALTTVIGTMYLKYRLDTGVWEHNVIMMGDNLSVLVCVFFLVLNALDLALGCIFYFEHLDPLSSWVHHTLYITLMLYCLKINATSGFVLFTIEEYPTYVLALGRMDKSLRSDAVFGLSFGALRILLHFAGAVYSFTHPQPTDRGLIVFLILTCAMHGHWFSTWVRKYGMKLAAPSKGKRA